MLQCNAETRKQPSLTGEYLSILQRKLKFQGYKKHLGLHLSLPELSLQVLVHHPLMGRVLINHEKACPGLAEDVGVAQIPYNHGLINFPGDRGFGSLSREMRRGNEFRLSRFLRP